MHPHVIHSKEREVCDMRKMIALVTIVCFAFGMIAVVAGCKKPEEPTPTPEPIAIQPPVVVHHTPTPEPTPAEVKPTPPPEKPKLKPKATPKPKPPAAKPKLKKKPKP